jgi:poly-gamma-glutamate synthesis protein (capsule biosynthesis protein)
MMILQILLSLVLSLALSCSSAHPTQAQAPPAPVPQDSLVTLVFAGDIMGHGPQINAAWDTATNSYDYTDNYRFIQSYIEKADLAVGNLEVTLSGKPYSGYPQFSSPDTLPFNLKQVGFDVLVTANNHCMDGTVKGTLRTLNVLDSARILHTGTFRSKEEQKMNTPLLLNVKGLRIAMLNYTFGTNGLPVLPPARVNFIDTTQMAADLAKTDSLKPDYVVVVLHWGEEYKRYPNIEQKTIARFLARKGVDFVIGSHPHVIQPSEVIYPIAGDSTHKTLVIYSLGNFVSNQRDRYKNGGLLFEIQINKYSHKINYSYSPVWVYKGKWKGKYQYYLIPPAAANRYPEYFDMNDETKGEWNLFYDDTRKHMETCKENTYFKELKY